MPLLLYPKGGSYMGYPIDVGRFQVYDNNTFSQTFGFEKNGTAYDLTEWTGWRSVYSPRPSR